MLSESPQAVEHTSRSGRWLQQKRIRVSVWIAVAEGIVVVFSHDVTKWTVVVLAVVGIVAWLGGRESGSHLVRQVLWIFAASQLLALILVIFGWFLKLALIVGVIVLAVLGLAYLFLDRR